MPPRWVRRRGHLRRLRGGGIACVRENWALLEDHGEKRSGSYRHPCPVCGADVTSVSMPRGGWVHFEGAKGLERVKHPCLHLGEGLGNVRDESTPDLFDTDTAPSSP